ncbi:hypothetical protein SD427_08230 [Chryseobacterium sp. JJR-5R]|uniref:hypothetical protein n=1 Tax=Chryseobacterium sp. JJR-5R TaxID=3093923 RepID=UPI002A74A53F|nr:hypothetical protein [Chryseobacterium sp. JJR-5R]WPO84309.1 hypothetical protein SD427_08230 [Chryseobacterium sp. JJR-5R]
METLNLSVFSIISLAIPLIMLVISTFYASRQLNTEAVLLVSGSGIVFIVAVFFIFMPYLMQSRNMAVEIVNVYYGIAGAVNFIGGLLFAIGFLMLVLTVIRQNKVSNAEKL